MSGLELAIVCGALIGLGVTVVVGRLLPVHPDLKSAFQRLDPARETERIEGSANATGFQDRLGIWAQKRAPAAVWSRIPRKDLALLQRPLYQHFGEKMLLGILGLIAPPLFVLFAGAVGFHLPFMLPVGASLVLAVVLFSAPDLTVRTEAAKARREFVRALASYIDLVALERASGTGSTQSLEAAAGVGDSWVFNRIAEELARARWSGQAPWDGLKELSDSLGLPELADLAEIMRLSREEGASVAGQLRARSTSIRSALLNADLAKANAAGEQLSVPVSVLAIIFLALIATPAVLRIWLGS